MSSLRFATQREEVINITGEQITHMTETPIPLLPAPGENQFILPRHMITELIVGNRHYFALFGTGEGSVTFYDTGDPATANVNTAGVGGSLGVLLGGGELFNISGHHYMLVESDFGLFTVKTIQSFVTDVTACTNKGLLLTYLWGSTDPAPPGPIALGPILASTLDNGGTGYVVGDVGYVNSVGEVHDALYEVTSVDGGVVTGYTITDQGTSTPGPSTYVQPVGTTATTGVGTGLQMEITDIGPDDTQLRLTIAYDLITPLVA